MGEEAYGMNGVTLEIERLGQRGEGVARHQGETVFVPYALAGEKVVVEIEGDRAKLVEILAPSTDRIAPLCPHYGVCGGCAVQSLAPPAYAEWKRGLVVSALRYAGLDAEVSPLVDAHGAGRRRVTFHARGARVGFMQARAHDIVEIDACPLLEARLASALPAARALAQALEAKGKPLDIAVTATRDGLDVDLRGAGALEEKETLALIDVAARFDLARLSNHGRIVTLRRKPHVEIGTVAVTPPAGGFLQATAQGEAEIAKHVLSGLGEAKRVADLFCGVGAFALRLAAKTRVFACDADADAVAALQECARSATGLKPIEAKTRDLIRTPLRAEELVGFDAVVFDPPRAGAAAQCEELARSATPILVAVSCNAQSFARDASILSAAGYAMGEVVVIDQFRHSAHAETVACFHMRNPTRRKRSLLSR